MKGRYLTIFIMLAAAAACDILGDGLQDGRPRMYCERGRGDGSSSNAGSHGHPGPEDGTPAFVPDTSIFISAVRCEPGYDWRRDTAYGVSSSELLLMHDGEVIVCVPTSAAAHVCTEPDMHHIIGGHLYTEFSNGTRTYIGRDGEELFSFEGREFLKGLCEKDGKVYTLSEKRSGKGFSFRENGTVIISSSSGDILGSFSEPSYRGTGALYLDDGKVCFTYSSGSSLFKQFNLVRDGEESSPGRGPNILDVRSVQGKDVVAKTSFSGMVWSNARIWPESDGYLISGDALYNGSRCSGILDTRNGEFKVLGPAGLLIYYKNGMSAAMDPGSMEGCFFFPGACADMLGSNLAKVITPLDTGRPPYLDTGDRIEKYEGFNGFLTGLSTEISLPTKVGGSRQEGHGY